MAEWDSTGLYDIWDFFKEWETKPKLLSYDSPTDRFHGLELSSTYVRC